MQKYKLLSKLFSDIRTYFVLFVIILFGLGFLYRHVQEGYRIVEVLETKTEPAIELKVTTLKIPIRKIILALIIIREISRVIYIMITTFLMVPQLMSGYPYLKFLPTICQASVQPHDVTHLHGVNIGRKMDRLVKPCHLNL